MKTYYFYATLLALSSGLCVRADEQLATSTTLPSSKKHYTGTVVSVDPNEHTLRVKWWAMFNKSFNLGDDCIVSQLENSHASVNDLRPGEKITVGYVKVHGVLIANRIEQDAMRCEGAVKAMDTAKGTLTLGGQTFDRQLQIADDCKVGLRNGKTGSFANIRIGNYVTVTYELPAKTPVIRQIDQASISFNGKLTAIDLEEKTLKARTAFGSKKFNVADDCVIVINGKTDGRMDDLRLNEGLDINYDTINGVRVANRIAPVSAETPTNSATGSTAMINN